MFLKLTNKVLNLRLKIKIYLSFNLKPDFSFQKIQFY